MNNIVKCLVFISLSLVFLKLSAENTTVFYFIRHGQTDWNVEKRIQGQLPIVLNDTGRQQAAIMDMILHDVVFNACYSSDLPRAYETAQIIAANRGLEIRAEPRIRERHRGKWQGRLEEEYAAASQEDKIDVETDEVMCARIFSFLNEIMQQHENETVLILTHEQVIGNIVKEILQLDCDAVDIKVSHTGVLQLENCGGQLKIKQLVGITLPQEYVAVLSCYKQQ